MSLQQLCVLGATGSIGASTLDVVARHPDRYRIFALSGHRRLQELADLCRRFQPVYAAVPDQASVEQLAGLLQGVERCPEILVGEAGLEAIAAHPEVDTVMAAIVGAAGLKPTLAAVKAGKRVLLANKEALVMSGALFIEAVQASGATLLPIDSEHNAIFQCLADPATPGLARKGVRRILLTASGGPFRETLAEELIGVTPDQACAHPKWSMGRKISVDSATLMNKGLELIEACWLFEATPEQVEVVIHPQSVIHSLVDYVDGSVLAQLGNPDMRTPIAHALAWPERIDSGVSALDLFEIGRLDFERPDEERFPCLRLAREAAQAGGCMPATLNAANEVAVEAFLEGRLGFTEIPLLIESVLKGVEPGAATDLAAVFAADNTARQLAREWLSRR
ncbi:1-deoxy-D-xylulose-5-phosphate reductoisomerase [Pseudomonas sp. SORGH_AS 211]|uniref:1-deoxy-D-xylulose-5-phosphate reductoisomerase n=1 Tax=Pseudomonas sp. SORGH_AS_0211 TaxID=3041796 RepID=UPI00285955D5|nr:1-deoxy-D-xylulose-5-phosphate reductoisomerase [Pseudomonas sp. SORGH_AS_0211]MDR6177463.1 1-deoxy-D-xylulose-5-phosphate reductoisomerase [Pseudomonas sp. SORGH_AS_0211]